MKLDINKPFITLTVGEVSTLFYDCLLRIHSEQGKAAEETTTYSFNQVAKLLKVSHTTVKKLVADLYLMPTSDGKRISAREVRNYLNNTMSI